MRACRYVLPLLGRLVLGVLPQVAELARPLDLLWQLRLQFPLELLNLVLESLQNLRFHRSSGSNVRGNASRKARC